MRLSRKACLRMAFVKLKDCLMRVPFARPTTDFPTLPYAFRLSQPFKPSPTLESKKHNLRTAAERINRLLIRPDEVFSFWHAVGNPNNRKRFREGRSIHAGKATTDIGGGLCQASGIIHHMALLTGLDILERHNHSVDLYTEESRFAPLGTDATVFYGFKDLRLRNNTGGPIRLVLEVGTDQVSLQLLSDNPIPVRELAIRTTLSDDGSKHVTVTDTARSRIVSTSVYHPLRSCHTEQPTPKTAPNNTFN